MNLKTVVTGYLSRLSPGSAVAFWLIVSAAGWCLVAGLIALVLR